MLTYLATECPTSEHSAIKARVSEMMNVQHYTCVSEQDICRQTDIVQAYKRRGEKYKVLWPEREEFVRMAAKFEATIVPMASIGCEDAVTMLADAKDIKRIPILGERVARNARETIPQARR